MSNNSFKPTPFRGLFAVHALRSHGNPRHSRRGLTQVLDR